MILFLYLLYDFLISGGNSNRVPGMDCAGMGSYPETYILVNVDQVVISLIWVLRSRNIFYFSHQQKVSENNSAVAVTVQVSTMMA